jgi:hypothetical protein
VPSEFWRFDLSPDGTDFLATIRNLWLGNQFRPGKSRRQINITLAILAGLLFQYQLF